MALTDCPACNKKMSDKAKVCPNCGFAFGNASEEEIERKMSLVRFHKKQRVQNQSMIAMLMFIGGFGFMHWGGAQPGDLQHNLAIGSCVIGFSWYVVNRVRLALMKRG